MAKGEPVLSALQFCGVLYAKVEKIRALSEPTCDVIYDPKLDDDAHANLVILDKSVDEVLTVTDALLGALVWVSRDQMAAVPALG
jgi:hypothetical protein